jgi:hypothetical protein
MLKFLSGADIEFLKRSIRFFDKNKELSHRDKNRVDFLLSNLSKDETIEIFTDIVMNYEKTKNPLNDGDIH